MRIAVVASEVAPFSKTGGLADVTGSLPMAISQLGHKVAVFSPYHRSVTGVQRVTGEARRVINLPVKVGERVATAGLFHKRIADVEFYFIENKEFFAREYLYGTPEGDYPDNCERFVFFTRAALEAMVRLEFAADVVHCHDWQTGLLPLYLKEHYARNHILGRARTAFTIHNLGYQGRFPGAQYPLLGLPWEYFTPSGLEFYSQLNFLKAALTASQILTTVSPTYAREIQTPELGFGLEGVLKFRAADLHGILNGIDYSVWNPAADSNLGIKYDASDIAPREAVKQGLVRDLKLDEPLRPLFGFVGRLSAQKGLDLLVPAAEAILELGANIAILGTGDEQYQRAMTEMQKRFPGRVAVRVMFDEPLAHRMYAGCDVLLIPSRYEPCGLTQMIAFRYGSVPLAHRTGGLADTVIDVTTDPARGNGFLFTEYTPDALLGKLTEALHRYEDKPAWNDLILRGMRSDFSWPASARKYVELFQTLIESNSNKTSNDKKAESTACGSPPTAHGPESGLRAAGR